MKQQTNTKGAVRNLPDDVPALDHDDLQSFAWAINAGGALTLAQCESDEPFALDFSILPASID